MTCGAVTQTGRLTNWLLFDRYGIPTAPTYSAVERKQARPTPPSVGLGNYSLHPPIRGPARVATKDRLVFPLSEVQQRPCACAA